MHQNKNVTFQSPPAYHYPTDMMKVSQTPKPTFLGMDSPKALIGTLVATFILVLAGIFVGFASASYIASAIFSAVVCIFGMFAIRKQSPSMMDAYFWLSIIGLIIQVVFLGMFVSFLSHLREDSCLMSDMYSNGSLSLPRYYGIQNCSMVEQIKNALIVRSVLVGVAILLQSIILFQVRKLIDYVSSTKSGISV